MFRRYKRVQHAERMRKAFRVCFTGDFDFTLFRSPLTCAGGNAFGTCDITLPCSDKLELVSSCRVYGLFDVFADTLPPMVFNLFRVERKVNVLAFYAAACSQVQTFTSSDI